MAADGSANGANTYDIVLLGPVGAGKGTQARLISSKLGVPHVASGELLREHRAKGSDLGKEAQAYMDRGSLVPDDLVIGMILDRMQQPDAARGVLLDGFPRNLPQAEALDAKLAREGRTLRSAVYLNVPTDVLIRRASERLTCRSCQATYNLRTNPPKVPGLCDVCSGPLYQREDDQPEVVSRRIDVYLRDTVPVVDYYRRRGILREIDGTRDIAEVERAIEQELAPAV